MRKICYTISLLGIQDRNRRIFSGLEFFFFNDTGLFHIATVAWEHRKLETKSKEAKLTYTRRIYKNTGPYIAGGRRGQLPPPGKLNVFFLT